MKERPILFSAPMVRALMAGTKTQTRRVVKWREPEPGLNMAFSGLAVERTWRQGVPEWVLCADTRTSSEWRSKPTPCPYGQPGDRLWVRETFAIVPRTAYRASEGVQQTLRPDDDHDAAIYREGWTRSNGGFRWRPSIHMPRWASRITLEVTEVRVERLQDISIEDAKAEGAWPDVSVVEDCEAYSGIDTLAVNPYRAFQMLWERINGPESWSANPWAWAITFKRVEK